MIMETIKERTLQFIREKNLFAKNESVLVALSGGADSVSLLHLLCSLKEEIGLQTISAIHIHHGIRKEEADRDAQFCKVFCETLQIPFYLVKVDVPKEAKKTHQTEEETGRRLRYEHFQEKAKELSAKIATAHTLSDNAETILLHVTRGTGLNGLTGIPVASHLIVRPILFLTRKEVEQYCEENNLDYVLDSTNQDITYSRNRIRQQVIPQLKVINPQVEEALSRMGCLLKEDEEVFSQLAKKAMEESFVEGKGYATNVLKEYPKAVRMRVYRALLYPAINVEKKHYDSLDQLLFEGGYFNLPSNVIARSDGEYLELYAIEKEYPAFSYEITKENPFFIDSVEYGLFSYSKKDFEKLLKVNNLFFNYCFDCDRIKGSLNVRQRLPGDSYHPVGRNTKTLKKLFNETSISSHERSRIPVLTDEEGIVMVYGFGCDERVKITEDTKQVIVFAKKNLLDSLEE
ncbi:MAG: tRNA lysidine(34) synthetase TilS [Clostridia bacterium]|nr:tRNA lysidine(34) synthetase TilS [Clostridia bacterium]